MGERNPLERAIKKTKDAINRIESAAEEPTLRAEFLADDAVVNFQSELREVEESGVVGWSPESLAAERERAALYEAAETLLQQALTDSTLSDNDKRERLLRVLSKLDVTSSISDDERLQRERKAILRMIESLGAGNPKETAY